MDSLECLDEWLRLMGHCISRSRCRLDHSAVGAKMVERTPEWLLHIVTFDTDLLISCTVFIPLLHIDVR